MKKFGCGLTELQNRISRHEATLEGNTADNEQLAQLSNFKATKTTLEKCRSLVCIITAYDSDVLWFQCDQCDEWCHGVCEGLTPLEEEQLGNSSDIFKCNRCRDKRQQQIPMMMETKAITMLEEEDKCRATLLALEKERNELQEVQDKRCGEMKGKLKSALQGIGVKRGQYHCGAFNGNMVIRLLERHQEFLQPFVELEILH